MRVTIAYATLFVSVGFIVGLVLFTNRPAYPQTKPAPAHQTCNDIEWFYGKQCRAA